MALRTLLGLALVITFPGCAESSECQAEPKYGTTCTIDENGHDSCSEFPAPPPPLVEPDYARP